MVAKVLTVQSVERSKPDPVRRLEIPDAALPGLYLVIQPSGVKSWAVRYRFQGRTRKLTIGAYPLFDLSAARAAARNALQKTALGDDPILAKKAAAAAADAASRETVRAVAALYVERRLKPKNKPRYVKETEALLRNHVLPHWGDRPIAGITRKEAIDLIDKLIEGGMGVGANRVFAAARGLFNFALDREVIQTTPFLRLKPPLPENERERVLSDQELRLVWLAACRVGYPFGTMVRLLLLTALRRDEIANMSWQEVDADGLLTLPSERTKNGYVHLVPLPLSARAILDSVPRIGNRSGFVFTTDGSSASYNFAKNKAKLDDTMLALAREEAEAAGKDPDAAQLASWRLQDLRRTCSTGMAEDGVPIHVGEAVLNHVAGTVSGVARIYNRYKYLPEKRAALEAWASRVESIVSGSLLHG